MYVAVQHFYEKQHLFKGIADLFKFYFGMLNKKKINFTYFLLFCFSVFCYLHLNYKQISLNNSKDEDISLNIM